MAIEKLCHSALVSKLIAIGIDENSARFISSFLNNHLIRPVKGGFTSNKFYLNARVPQVHSNSLFLRFINNLLHVKGSPISSFAEHNPLCRLLFFIGKPSSTEMHNKRCMMNDILNRNPIKLTEWGQANRVNFDANKTKYCL